MSTDEAIDWVLKQWPESAELANNTLNVAIDKMLGVFGQAWTEVPDIVNPDSDTSIITFNTQRIIRNEIARREREDVAFEMEMNFSTLSRVLPGFIGFDGSFVPSAPGGALIGSLYGKSLRCNNNLADNSILFVYPHSLRLPGLFVIRLFN